MKLSYNPQITEQQHYVPSHFLSAWCNNGLLWVSNKDGKLFQQKPKNVAKDKGIYSLEAMTADEFIESFSDIITLRQGINPYLFQLIMDNTVSNLLFKEIINGQISGDDYDKIISFIVKENLCSQAQINLLSLMKKIHDIGVIPKEIEHFCIKHFIEGIEPFITNVEHLGFPLIEKLRNNDSSFLRSSYERECFLLYVGLQVFRVLKFTNLAEKFGQIKPKTLKLTRPIFVAYIVNYLQVNWNEFIFNIVDNTTELEFITGDNPICNLDNNVRTRYLDLYFPISPTKAVFICNKDRLSLFPEMRCMTLQYVHELNQNMSLGCTNQVFACKYDTLHYGRYKPTFDISKLL